MKRPLVILIFLIATLYYQFFLFGKIPFPGDTLVGAYFPWLDYKWGYSVGVPVKNPPISDVFSQLYIWRNLSVDLLRVGTWPLWNPYSSSGSVLLANYQSAPFLPFNILLLLPKYFGWGLYIFCQTLMAAIGMFLLVGIYTKNSSAKIAAALVFSLGGLMTTYTEFAMAGFAAAMLPWIFSSLEFYWRSKQFRFLTLLTLSFAALYLSGHAQITLYSSFLFLIYLSYNKISKQIKTQEFFLPLTFWILGIGIAALQLLPTIDHLMGASIRTAEEYSWTFNYGLNSWYELVRLAAADFFGNPTTYNHWDSVSYHEHSTFLGTLTIPLMVPLLFKRFRDSRITFWGVIFMSTIFLAFDSPITKFLYSLPLPLLTNSSASRIFFVMIFAAAILTGFAIQKFQENINYRKLANKFLLSLTIIILTGLVLVFAVNSFKVTQNFIVSFKNSILPIVILIVGLVLIKFFHNKRWIVYIIVAILFLDLGRFFLKYNPFVPKSYIYPETPLTTFLQNQKGLFRIARLDSEILPPNTWVSYKISSMEGYDPLSLQNYGHFFNKIKNRPFNDGLSRYLEITSYPSKFLDALNTKYLLAIKRDDKGNIPGDTFKKTVLASGYKEIFEDKNSAVLENPDAKERAYFTKTLTVVKDRMGLIKKMDDPEFDPTSEAVIIGNQEEKTFDGQGQVKFVSYSSDTVTIETQTNTEQFMVFADTFEKGWKLFLNGQPDKIFQTNEALRGIIVPKGKNEFRFEYQPNSFGWGLKLTIISLVALLMTSLISVKRKLW